MYDLSLLGVNILRPYILSVDSLRVDFIRVYGKRFGVFRPARNPIHHHLLLALSNARFLD